MVGGVLDVLFSLDVAVRFRTAYRDHGYDVTHPHAIAANYLRGWFALDFMSSLPFDQMLAMWRGADALSVFGGGSDQRVASITQNDKQKLQAPPERLS